MKTAHQLARELLAGPDLPIYHFDASRAGMDEEADTSLADPIIELERPIEGDPDEEKFDPFITICGDFELGEELDVFAALAAEREKSKKLRAALVGVIDADGEIELRGLLHVVSSARSGGDQAVAIVAITALLETLPAAE